MTLGGFASRPEINMRFIKYYLLTFTLLTLGCGGGNDSVTVHPVSGQVLYDHKPAAGVQVFLYPTSAPMMPQIPMNPRGVTGPDGRFKISTYGEGDGAAEG